MKLAVSAPKLSFRTITSAAFLLIVAVELWFTFNYLYRNLRPHGPPVDTGKIIRADLNGYRQVYSDLTSRSVYVPIPYDYQNPNPFKFGP